MSKTNDKEWLEKYELANEYFLEFGNLLIPQNYEIKGIKLGYWIDRQRKNYKNNKLSQEQIKLLEEINMVWDPLEEQWQKNYELAEEYFKEFGNLLIPNRYETKNGIKLGQWIGTQRRDYKNEKISKERIELLESIGMVWDSLEAQWQEFYNLAKQYNSEFGNLLIPARYEIKGVKLGVWLANQRIAYKNEKLSQERINLLESIGMVWDPLEAQWQINYKLTEQYYNKFGNLLIPYDYETFDGIKLNLWLRRQRKDYR